MNSILDLQTVLGVATIVGLVVIVRSVLRIFNVGLGLFASASAIVLQYVFDLSPRESIPMCMELILLATLPTLMQDK